MDVGAALNVGTPITQASGPPATSLGGPSKDASAPNASGGLMKEWNDWLSQPGNRAAVVTAGLQMMQPIGVGQSVLGHIARAVGKGGEAKQEQVATEAKQKSAVSQQALEAAQAKYYEGRGLGGMTGYQQANLTQDEQKRYDGILKAVIENMDPIGMDSIVTDPEKMVEAQRIAQEIFEKTKIAQSGTLNQAIPASPQGTKIPGPQAIAYLKAHPETRVQFEKTFGIGSASRYAR